MLLFFYHVVFLPIDGDGFPLEAYSACLNIESKFFYTTIPLGVCFIINLVEFLVLESKYESTGLRKRIMVSLYLALGYTWFGL